MTLGAYDDNDISIDNHQNIVVPEIPPAPAPFDGQFLQLDVLSVAPRRRSLNAARGGAGNSPTPKG